MNSTLSKLNLSFLGLCLSSRSPTAYAEWTLNMTPGVTEISREVYDLHMLILAISSVIGLIVAAILVYSFIYYRHSKGRSPSKVIDNTKLEIVWTIIPAIILIVMAVPATKTLAKIYNSENSDIDILVTGYQWRWHYNYINEGIGFFSNLSTPADQLSGEAIKGRNYLLEVDEPMVVPVGKKIRFLTTSNDVIHSIWVPAISVKKDAIPGFINEAWTRIDRAGIYRGQCTELCGQRHGYMPVVIEAKSESDYLQWLSSKQHEQKKTSDMEKKTWSLEQLIKQGKSVYETNCVACHQLGGVGIDGLFPALKGSTVVQGEIIHHIDIVLNGKPGTSMQAYRQQLGALEIAAVINFERNAWGNSSNQMVTPAQIRAVMDEQGPANE